jgi:hypothetical protein
MAVIEAKKSSHSTKIVRKVVTACVGRSLFWDCITQSARGASGKCWNSDFVSEVVRYWSSVDARAGWLRVPHPLHPAGTGPAHPRRGEGDGVEMACFARGGAG